MIAAWSMVVVLVVVMSHWVGHISLLGAGSDRRPNQPSGFPSWEGQGVSARPKRAGGADALYNSATGSPAALIWPLASGASEKVKTLDHSD
jgi:hypothetical protein